MNALSSSPDGSEVNGEKTRCFAVGHATQVTVERVFFAFREVHGFHDFVRGGVVLFFLKIEGNDGGMSVLIVGHAGEILVVFEDFFEIALHFRKAGVSDCDVLSIFVVAVDFGDESALELPKETDSGLGAVVSFGKSVSGILEVKEVFDKRETKFLDAFASVGDDGLDSVQGENLSHERDVGLVDGFGKELFAGIVFSQRELVEKRSHKVVPHRINLPFRHNRTIKNRGETQGGLSERLLHTWIGEMRFFGDNRSALRLADRKTGYLNTASGF